MSVVRSAQPAHHDQVLATVVERVVVAVVDDVLWPGIRDQAMEVDWLRRCPAPAVVANGTSEASDKETAKRIPAKIPDQTKNP